MSTDATQLSGMSPSLGFARAASPSEQSESDENPEKLAPIKGQEKEKKKKTLANRERAAYLPPRTGGPRNASRKNGGQMERGGTGTGTGTGGRQGSAPELETEGVDLQGEGDLHVGARRIHLRDLVTWCLSTVGG